MHDDGVVPCVAELVAVKAETVVVFALGGDEGAIHALLLQSEHHDDIGINESVFQVRAHLDAPFGRVGGHQGRRSDQPDPVFHLAEEQDVRSGDAGMRDVAADRNRQPPESPLGASDRQCVEKRLGRVFVSPVAGVDHGAVDLLRQQAHSARTRVADHEQIRMHGVERESGVDERLALFDRRRLHVHVHHVRSESLSRYFETRLRAGRVFEKHVDLRKSRERGVVLHVSAIQVNKGVSQVKKGGNLARLEMLYAEEVAGAKTHGRCIVWPALSGKALPFGAHSADDMPQVVLEAQPQ